jgi:hypothetical protein
MFQRFLSDAPSDNPARAEAEKYVAGAVATTTAPPTPTNTKKKPGTK